MVRRVDCGVALQYQSRHRESITQCGRWNSVAVVVIDAALWWIKHIISHKLPWTVCIDAIKGNNIHTPLIITLTQPQQLHCHCLLFCTWHSLTTRTCISRWTLMCGQQIGTTCTHLQTALLSCTKISIWWFKKMIFCCWCCFFKIGGWEQTWNVWWFWEAYFCQLGLFTTNKSLSTSLRFDWRYSKQPSSSPSIP